MGISPTKNGNINLNYSLAIQYSYGIDGSFADDLPIFHSYVKLQRADFFPQMHPTHVEYRVGTGCQLLRSTPPLTKSSWVAWVAANPRGHSEGYTNLEVS
jgi:hypothetical protein